MACHLFGAKPLSKPMLYYYQLDPKGTSFVESLIKIHSFSFTKMHSKASSAKWRPFCPEGDGLHHFCAHLPRGRHFRPQVTHCVTLEMQVWKKPKTIMFINFTWWRHQMEIFSVLLAICAGNSPVPDEFPTQRPVTRGFDVFFDLHLNKRLSKQPGGWWFQAPSLLLWCHCNASKNSSCNKICYQSYTIKDYFRNQIDIISQICITMQTRQEACRPRELRCSLISRQTNDTITQ